MSGGMPSGPSPAEGDHPACTIPPKPKRPLAELQRSAKEERKAGDTAGDARSAAEGLALTARGPQAPNFFNDRGRRPQASFKTGPQVPTTKPQSQPLAGRVIFARGIVTEWRRPCAALREAGAPGAARLEPGAASPHAPGVGSGERCNRRNSGRVWVSPGS